ncbi:MAG: Prokaryotic membrane lipoprotein lipid attachment site [Rhodobacteraceae bacterium HLUCCA08]|nr:MAG: Prokaryotic membrane lipoprotein lipid attachment site [Rhodobacteraceae bacterium HLUCCA08]
MALKKLIVTALLTLGVAGCSSPGLPSRNAPLDTPELETTLQVAPRDYRVQAFVFLTPDDLTVSEGNGYYPFADIVWRGDPIGNRVEQISAIFETAVLGAGEALDGATPVTVEVTLRRFHSLTERTRYTIGGVHSIKFDLTIRHFETREVLEGPRAVDASFPGLGGLAAIAAEQRGETQKVRILQQLTAVFTDELSGPPPAAAGL